MRSPHQSARSFGLPLVFCTCADPVLDFVLGSYRSGCFVIFLLVCAPVFLLVPASVRSLAGLERGPILFPGSFPCVAGGGLFFMRPGKIAGRASRFYARKIICTAVLARAPGFRFLGPVYFS
jgi:hypothetical protein